MQEEIDFRQTYSKVAVQIVSSRGKENVGKQFKLCEKDEVN